MRTTGIGMRQKHQALHQCCVAETRTIIQKQTTKPVAVTEHTCWLVMSPERKAKLRAHQQAALKEGVVAQNIVATMGAIRPVHGTRACVLPSSDQLSVVCAQLVSSGSLPSGRTAPKLCPQRS